MSAISPKEVGERIRAVRGRKTQEEFAKILKLPQNYISMYERRRIPRPELLVKIAALGRVSTDWLLTGKGKGLPLASIAGKSNSA